MTRAYGNPLKRCAGHLIKPEMQTKESGFSLIETLVSFGILSVGMLSVGLMLFTSLGNDKYNHSFRFGQVALNAKIEEIRARGAKTFSPQAGIQKFDPAAVPELIMSGSSDTSGGWKNPEDSGYNPNSWATREWQITLDPDTQLSRILVTVKWDKYQLSQVSYAE